MQKTIDLSGRWKLKNRDGRINIHMNLPGDTADALIRNGLMPHPYEGRKELEVQWISREDWILEREVELTAEEIRSSLQYLTAGALDTIARIEINGRPAGSSDNMFAPGRFPVAGLLQAGTNTIRIYLDSPEKEAVSRAENRPYPVPTMHYPIYSPHRNMIRKVQCHAGWDWGPCIMTSGVYGGIALEMSEWRLEALHYDLIKNDKTWTVRVHLETEAGTAVRTSLRMEIAGAVLVEELTLPAGCSVLTRDITVESPDLWWPAGQGEQTLYDLKVCLGEREEVRRVGFRTIEVITADDEVGRSMTVRVNGRDIFCKGANWIPTDALPSGQTVEKTEHLLKSARDAHMNMIRVWGGGQYEPDRFYDLCDELGLMIWQDFMFSCSLYPSDPAFLASVETEARYQVKRLKNHPCLTLWCGNNEDVGALTWFEESRKNRDIYLVDYDRLNEGVLGRAVRELDPQRAWWPSSPSAGQDDYSDCWHDDTKGDMHYWSVWHEGKPFESYYDILPRFCSEFGFQSFPSLETVRTYAPEEEWNVSAPAMMHHQKNERGNEIIMSTLCRYFRFPQRFEDFLYLSQVQQAWAIRTAVEYWRSNRPVSMGALYWQLNDNWPVASWSSIEYSGAWKLLHHEAARFYRPVHITGWMKDGRLHAAAVNDAPEEKTVECILNFRGFDGSLKRQETRQLTLAGGSADRFFEEELAGEEERRDTFLELILKSEEETVRNFLFLHVPRMCSLNDADVKMTREDDGTGRVLRLSADRPAFFAYLTSTVPGHFSDNGFLLMPGEEKTVRFIPRDPAAGEPEFSVTHLRETY